MLTSSGQQIAVAIRNARLYQEAPRELAEEQGEKAIGVIFSGTGPDGTLGLRAIQGAGGVSLF